MRLSFEPLHDLAMEAFKSDEGADTFEYALKCQEKKVSFMYDRLLNCKEDYFVQKDEPSEAGRSLIYTWTRSTRKDVKIQMTVWLCVDKTKTITALSHHDVKSADDMSRNAEPMEGIVYGSSESDIPVLEFMENVIPDTDYHSLAPVALNR